MPKSKQKNKPQRATRRSSQNTRSEDSQQPEDDQSSDVSSTQSGLQTHAELVAETKARGRGVQSQGRSINKQPPPSRGRNRRASRSITHDSLDSLNSTDHSGVLYDSIRNDRFGLEEIVGSWIKSYKRDKDLALLSLQQLSVSASGCTGVLTPEMRELEHAELIRQMSPMFDRETGEYPLIMRGSKWESFRRRFGEFWAILVDQCQHSIIYDQELLIDTTTFLIGLSDSQIRAFRHTATFAAMKLATALVRVTLTVSQNLRNARRRLEAERQESQSSERIEVLVARVEELEENYTELVETLGALYSSVFVHRYIDISEDIRTICMIEIGNWMDVLPDIYVNDKYLKYVGWNLSDKSPEVRFHCQRSLITLYSKGEVLKPKLEGFTSTFKPRIVAMVLDRDPDCAAEAVKLITLILMYYREFLDDADCERVYELVYSPNRDVAQASGAFLHERLFRLDEHDDSVILRSRRGKPRLPNAPLVRDLVLFFIESELHEHSAYLVDSLVDSNPMIKDWECMTDLLLEDAGPEEETLSNEAETCLIDIMVCSVKQAATGESPIGRTPSRNIQSKSVQRQIENDRKKLTEHFIPALPLLLEKYRADPEKLANLLTIAQHLDLTVYSSLRQEQSLESLLRKIGQIVEITLSADFLEVAATTVAFFCSDSSSIAAQCQVSRSLLIGSLVDRYKRAIVKYRSEIARVEGPSEDDIFAAVQSLKKISIFYNSHDMNTWNIRESLFRDIEDAKNSSADFPDEAVVYCISACRNSLLWSQNSLTNPRNDSTAELKLVARQLRRNLDDFVESITYFVDGERNDSSPISSMAIREEAFSTICDLLVMFSAQLTRDSNTLLHELVYDVEEHLQGVLSRFVQERVFRYEENAERDEAERIDELQKRRNLLAGYCKLIAYNILPTRCAADVFKRYASSYNDYGDIIKETLVKARDINRINCALTMLHSLTTLFLEILTEQRRDARRELGDLKAIKELARKFILLFGFRSAQNHGALVAIHSAGILFATKVADGVDSTPAEPPENLLFLEVLCEFSKKLPEPDRRVVLDFLNSSVHVSVPSKPDKEWKPLFVYRSSLMQGSGNVATARRRKKNQATEDGSGNAEGEQSNQKTRSRKKTRVAKKNPLSVSKVTFARGPLSTVGELSLTPASALAIIDDSSENRHNDEIHGIDTSQTQRERRSSRRRTSFPVLYDDDDDDDNNENNNENDGDGDGNVDGDDDENEGDDYDSDDV